LVVIPGAIGRRRDFNAGQIERARILKALHAKGVTLSQLARADLGRWPGVRHLRRPRAPGMPRRHCGDRRSGPRQTLVFGGRSGGDPHGRCGMKLTRRFGRSAILMGCNRSPLPCWEWM
jgi:hypothetical protein